MSFDNRQRSRSLEKVKSMKITILNLVRGGFLKSEIPNNQAVWFLKRNDKIILKTDKVHRNWRGSVTVIDREGNRYSEIEDLAKFIDVKY
jgi:hypothetical protein